MTRAGTSPEQAAVVGMACRVPGADSVAGLWRLMCRAESAIGPVPASRRTLADLADAGRGAGSGGFLDDVHGFDAGHFGVSPAEAPHLDVQQRLVLETAWHALEDAGIPLQSLAGTRTGVFAGQATHDHAMLYERGGLDPSPFLNTGISHALVANRLSYHWDLRGPSLAVDTACSSSLVALHLALRSLRSHECDLVIVAGVNALLSPWPQLGAAALTALSPTGRCRPFDAEADGYVRSEGVGVVVLRRLGDTEDDRVRAVIRGSATNQDGRTNGVTAPSGRAQTEVVRAALADARTTAAELSYVETHGTGTPLGDPIEARALAAAMDGRSRPLPIGSVKGNIGHTEAAAGILGVIRAVLVLEHGQVPPQAGHVVPNPAVDLDRLCLSVPTATRPLADDAPVAGVSSFGFGGTNAHVVLAAPEAAVGGTERQRREPAARPLLLVSGSAPDAVRTLLQHYADSLAEGSAEHAARVVASATTRRSHLPYRVAVPAASLDDLAGAAATAARQRRSPRIPLGRRRVGFVFSGHGSQWVGMGRRLLAEEEVFARSLAECDTAFGPLLGRSVAALLTGHDEDDLTDVAVVQPLLFTIQVGLARSLAGVGVVPDAVVGHSIGEVAAAVVAGAVTLADGCRVVHHRNRAVTGVRGSGGMAVLELGAEEAESIVRRLGAGVDLAAVNSPRSCVVSGREADLERVLAAVTEAGADCRRVRVDYPSHSRLVDDAAKALAGGLTGLRCASPTCDVYSSVDGGRAVGRPDAAYWGRNLRQRVRFSDAVRGMHDDGITHFLELAPHPVLTGAVRDTLGEGVTALPMLTREPGGDTLAPALGALYEAGVDLDYPRLTGRRGSAAVPLPLYPFDHGVTHQLRYGRRHAPDAATAAVPIPPDLRTDHRIGDVELVSATSLALLTLALATDQRTDAVVGTVEQVELLAPLEAAAAVHHDAGSRTLLDQSGRPCLRYAAARPTAVDAEGHPVGGVEREDLHAPAEAGPVDAGACLAAARAAGLDLSAAGSLVRGLVRRGSDAWARVGHHPGDRSGARTLEAALIAGLIAVVDGALPGGRGTDPAGQFRAVSALGGLTVSRALGRLPPGELVVRIRGASAQHVEEVAVLDGSGDRVARITDVRLARGAESTPGGATAGTVTRSAAAVRAVVRDVLTEVVPDVDWLGGVDHVPFAELGVDSLLAAELRNRIERRLGLQLSMSIFWRHPTVEQLTHALADDDHRRSRGAAAGPVDPAEAGPGGAPADPLSELLAVLAEEQG